MKMIAAVAFQHFEQEGNQYFNKLLFEEILNFLHNYAGVEC